MNRHFPLIISALLLLFSVAEAQDTVIPWNTPRYWTYIPSDYSRTRFNCENTNPPGEGMYAYGLSQSITGYAYYTPQPVLVYGIAASVSTIRWGCTGRPDEVHIADLYCDPLVHRMDSLQIWAILIEKRGDSFRRVDSVCWHYRSRPDIVWKATHDTNEVGIYACEFFFDHPLSVYDTFFVCMSVRGEAIEDDCTDADGSYHRMSVINNPVSCPGHVHVKYQYQSGMTNPDLSYFSGITTLYAHPIIVPPDTDAVGCQPPTLRFLTSVSGFPWFSYSLTTDEEAVGYEVQYAPVGSFQQKNALKSRCAIFTVLDRPAPPRFVKR